MVKLRCSRQFIRELPQLYNTSLTQPSQPHLLFQCVSLQPSPLLRNKKLLKLLFLSRLLLVLAHPSLPAAGDLLASRSDLKLSVTLSPIPRQDGFFMRLQDWS